MRDGAGIRAVRHGEQRACVGRVERPTLTLLPRSIDHWLSVSVSPPSCFHRCSSAQLMDVDVEQVRVDAHVAFLDTLAAQLDLLDGISGRASPRQRKNKRLTRSWMCCERTSQGLLRWLARLRLEEGTKRGGRGCRGLEESVTFGGRASFGWQLDRRLDEEARSRTISRRKRRRCASDCRHVASRTITNLITDAREC